MVGSDRASVAAALREARPEAIAPVSFAADRASVAIGGGAGDRREVLLVRFAQSRVTNVPAGENAGRTLQDANGVTAVTRLGDWDGSARRYRIEPPRSGEGLAVLVQAADGRMLGAARNPRPGRIDRDVPASWALHRAPACFGKLRPPYIALTREAALATAFNEAVTMSLSMPTPCSARSAPSRPLLPIWT